MDGYTRKRMTKLTNAEIADMAIKNFYHKAREIKENWHTYVKSNNKQEGFTMFKSRQIVKKSRKKK